MCLTIEIKPSKRVTIDSGSLSHADGALFVSEVKNWRGKPRGILTISNDGEGGCACSMLSDEADWEDQYWSLNQDALRPLAITVSRISKLFSEGFNFTARWAGDESENTIPMTIHDFIEIIYQNKIQQNTDYHITTINPAGPQNEDRLIR